MPVKIQANTQYPHLQEVHVTNGNMSMIVVPSANMVVSSLTYKNVEVLEMRKGLKGYIENLSSFAFPFMAPWINRLTTTEYDFDGKHYSYSLDGIKVDENNYAMHGLLTANANWTYTVVENSSSVSVNGIFNYDNTVSGFEVFPFEHTIEVSYALNKNGMSVTTKITNKHDGKIPIAFGFHPHFVEATIKNVYGTDYKIPLNSKTIPVLPIDFNPNDSDTTAEMFKMIDRWHIDLRTAAGNMKITTKGYPYMLLWSPPDSNFIAVEPMTSNIDFFNTEGTVIDKDANYEAVYTLSF
jgi:aldose 1-epimerase